MPLYTHPLFQRAAGDAWRPGGRELTEHALDLCAFDAGARVLDVGCGNGETLELLEARGLRPWGLDKNLATHFPRLVQGDGAALPFGDAIFAGVVCQCVLSLLPRPDATLRGVARALQPGGRLLLSDIFVREGPPPTTEAPRSCLQGAIPAETLETLLRNAGLRVLTREDHTTALRVLTARLVWYGARRDDLLRWMGHENDGCCGKKFGYGLWIAEKE